MSDGDLENYIKKDSELIYDKVFVSKIYKRTERVCNALFYILDKKDIKDTDNESVIIGHIKSLVPTLLKEASHLLVLDTVSVKRHFVSFGSELLYLSSLITLAVTSERMQASYGGLITLEIDTLLSEIELFKNKDREVRTTKSFGVRRRAESSMVVSMVRDEAQRGDEDTRAVRVDGATRKERIKTILREKGQIGIKDISDSIKDVSEKSIQRDLNDLIEGGEVVRIGERRWSTYKVS